MTHQNHARYSHLWTQLGEASAGWAFAGSPDGPSTRTQSTLSIVEGPTKVHDRSCLRGPAPSGPCLGCGRALGDGRTGQSAHVQVLRRRCVGAASTLSQCTKTAGTSMSIPIAIAQRAASSIKTAIHQRSRISTTHRPSNPGVRSSEPKSDFFAGWKLSRCVSLHCYNAQERECGLPQPLRVLAAIETSKLQFLPSLFFFTILHSLFILPNQKSAVFHCSVESNARVAKNN